MASVEQRLSQGCERCLCGQWAKELGRVEELGLLCGVPCLGDFRAFVTAHGDGNSYFCIQTASGDGDSFKVF